MKQIAQSLAIASLLALAATNASAQAVRTEKNMSLDLANQIAAATEDETRGMAQFACRQLRRVDDGGVERRSPRQGEGVARR